MGTRGLIGFSKGDTKKQTYNHYDSYPASTGLAVLEYIASRSNIELNIDFDNITMVKEDDVPTLEQIQRCIPTADTRVSTGELTEWYVLLREAQGNLAKYSEQGFMIDNNDFLFDTLFCEFAYIINLDTLNLDFYGYDYQSGVKHNANRPITVSISLDDVRKLGADIIIEIMEAKNIDDEDEVEPLVSGKASHHLFKII